MTTKRTLAPISYRDLLRVQKPAQYMGGELNSIRKEWKRDILKVCLIFPDTYEVGMSHIGMRILYSIINDDKRFLAERAFVPLSDMENLLRERAASLFSLENRKPLKEFDVLGFSLQYELCSTGILNVLDLSGIPFYAEERGEEYPLIIGGGPYAYHPEPIAPFFDLFLVGDGEEAILEILGLVKKLKEEGASKDDMLEKLSEIEGVYIPTHFEPLYHYTGEIVDIRATGKKKMVKRRLVPNLNLVKFPSKPIVPNIRAVHDRLSVEVMRGCVRGCRFCQAGYLYRPQRERKPEEVLRIIDESLKETGYEEVSLLSLSTADYCSILPLLHTIKKKHCSNDELVVSFPSTRVDALKPELLREVQEVRRSGFTIAPEAGTQRLRDVINKGVTDEEIIETCTNVYRLGWTHIKMYFMLGLPTETEEDVLGIVELAKRIKAIKGAKDFTVSVSTLVPKPHTPFQWARQISQEETVEKQNLLKRELKKLRVNFRYHNSFSTFLEGVFARGDRRLAQVIETAYRKGCRLDGWVEEIQEDKWMSAFEECGIDPLFYLRERDVEEILPWDHISCDIPKEYFLREWERAKRNAVTPDCLTQSCSSCKACNYDTRRNILFDRKRTEIRLDITDPPWEKDTAEDQLIDIGMKSGAKRRKKTRQRVKHNIPEFGSGSIDFIPEDNDEIDYPFQSPEKEVIVHENVPHGESVGKKGDICDEKLAKCRIRFVFAKKEPAIYVGHLELAAIFFRAARRCSLPIAFSRGFNPKPRLIFGPPLQLGVSSSCELVDIFFTEVVDEEQVKDMLNSHLPEGIRIMSAKAVDTSEPHIINKITENVYELNTQGERPLPIENIKHMLGRGVLRSVRKGKRREIVLKDIVKIKDLNNKRMVFSIKNTPSTPSAKPFDVAQCLTAMAPEDLRIVKIDSLLAD